MIVRSSTHKKIRLVLQLDGFFVYDFLLLYRSGKQITQIKRILVDFLKTSERN